MGLFGNFFGRGAGKDIAKTAGNYVTAPVDMVLGTDTYNPDVVGKGAQKIENAQNKINQTLSPFVQSAVMGLATGGLGAAVGLGGSAAGGAAMGAIGQGATQGLNALGGTAGTPGSMDVAFQQGLSGTTGTSGFGAQIDTMNQFGGGLNVQMRNGGYLNQYAMGGNVFSFNGPSHEDGGINYQNRAEIEGNEVVEQEKNKGERVFSDDLTRPMPGVKKKNEKTYANWIDTKYKDNPNDDDITLRTKKMMRDKLFNEQETQKETMMLKDMNKFMAKYGGMLPKFPNGGMIPTGPTGPTAPVDPNPYPASMFANVSTPEQALALWKGQRTASGQDTFGTEAANKLMEANRLGGDQSFFDAVKQHTGMVFNPIAGDEGSWSYQNPNDPANIAQRIKAEANPQLRVVNGKLEQLRTQDVSGEHWQKSNPNMAYLYMKNQGMLGDMSRKDVMYGLKNEPQAFINSMSPSSAPVDMAPAFRKGGYMPTRNFGPDGYNDEVMVYGGAPLYPDGGELPTNTIFTTNPNDPRLRNYNDSLILHNTFKGDIAKLKATKTGDEWTKYVENFIGSPADKKSLPAFERLTKLPGGYKANQSYSKKFDYGKDTDRRVLVEAEAREYPKPKQPVKYLEMQRVMPKSFVAPNQMPSLMGGEYAGVPEMPTPTIIGYKQKWNPESRKWTQEPQYQVIPEPGMNLASRTPIMRRGGNLDAQIDADFVKTFGALPEPIDWSAGRYQGAPNLSGMPNYSMSYFTSGDPIQASMNPYGPMVPNWISNPMGGYQNMRTPAPTTTPVAGTSSGTMNPAGFQNQFKYSTPQANTSRMGLPAESSYSQGPMNTGRQGGFGGQGEQNNGWLNKALMAAPAAFNLFQGLRGTHQTDPTYNPEYDKAMGLMSGMRYNIRPELQQFAANRYALKKGITGVAGGHGGAELANRIGANVQYNRQVAESMARKQNMDNQYKAMEAQFRGNMGAQRAAAQLRADMMNQQASAQQDAYLGMAFNQLGHLGNVGQTNSIYRQLIDAGYGDLMGGTLGNIART